MNIEITNVPQHWQDQHGGRLQSMIDVALAAGKLTLTFYRNADLVIEAKADESPVTIADKSAEQLVRKLIREAYPDDTVQGEEFADAVGASRYRWIVDPIDGTKSFVCGVPLYSTLLALLIDDKPFAGIIVIPALGETICAAYGLGCWYRATDDSPWTCATVSNKSAMNAAVLLTSQRDLFARRNREADFVAIENECWVSRTWGDGYGYLLVATGRAEIMIDPMCNPWDIAAMGPIMKEAGGRFTDWNGTDSISSGDGFATNGLLHDRVRERLQTTSVNAPR
jgi:histidinol-phosphatase